MSKRILLDQLSQYKTHLHQISHPSVAQEWNTNKTLNELFEALGDIFPKGQTRSTALQMFDQYVEANNKDPNKWIAYLKNADYTKHLISRMKRFALKGQRIELQFERHPDLVLDAKIMAEEPMGVSAQKKQRTDESKQKTDKIFDPCLTEKQKEELVLICEKCGTKGKVKPKTQQIRSSDEAPATMEKCLACGHFNICRG